MTAVGTYGEYSYIRRTGNAGGIDSAKIADSNKSSGANGVLDKLQQLLKGKTQEPTGVDWSGETASMNSDTFTRTTNNDATNDKVTNDAKVKNDGKAEQAQKNKQNQQAQQKNNAKQGAGNTDAASFADNSTGNGTIKEADNNDKDTKGSTFGQKAGSGMQFGLNNDKEIKELAEALNCENSAEAVKKALANKSADELAEMDGNLLQSAVDMGLANEKDILQQTGANSEQINQVLSSKDNSLSIGKLTTNQNAGQNQDFTQSLMQRLSQAGGLASTQQPTQQQSNTTNMEQNKEDEQAKKKIQFLSLSGTSI